MLPHYSPGYPEWTIDEQPLLLDVIRAPQPAAVPLEVLESGMLRPKKSLLAVFGVTRHIDRVRPTEGVESRAKTVRSCRASTAGRRIAVRDYLRHPSCRSSLMVTRIG